MKTELLHKYANLKRELEAAKTAVANIQADIDSLEQVLLEQFADSGLANVKLADGRTVYTATTVWVRPKPGADIVGALRACGHEELLRETVNPMTLTAWAREVLAEGELPEQVAEAVIVTPVVQLKVLG